MANITSMEELLEYSKGQIVELPPFAENQPFVARLRRPSMLALTQSGKIPNSLLTVANRLFSGGGINDKNPNALKDLLGVLDVMAEACFIQPTYKEIKEAGLELTDEQMMFIFSYAQKGTQALETFRGEPKNNGTTGNVAEVQKDSV